MGAVDARHKAPTDIEEMKLAGTSFCGGVADIAKFFDQIRRKVVYTMASHAGMPKNILVAYTAYIENLLLYNCLAGGVGRPHKRKCGIPQGCPLSMMMVALIMRPWIELMKTVGVACIILADDVLILAQGRWMLSLFAKAIDLTHHYLQAMGPRVAPDKSYNFASTQVATRWLQETWWPHIGNYIEVVKDFRYLGAHLSTRASTRSPTLNKRWDKASQQLRKLKYCPATVEAKAKAIATKTFAAAFYGIEAAEIATAKVAQLTAAVIDVFRSRNDFHNVDWFFAAFFEDKKDLDPIVQIFTRRALQIWRTVCKKPGTKGQFLRILKLQCPKSAATAGLVPRRYDRRREASSQFSHSAGSARALWHRPARS